MKIRRYSELIQLSTFEDRYRYLKLDGAVGLDTFGFDREFNQMFYHSSEWKNLRRHIIARDYGCDMGLRDFPIYDKVLVHHMNPIALADIVHSTDILLEPEYLITVSMDTHNAIHYGVNNYGPIELAARSPADTCPWKVAK